MNKMFIKIEYQLTKKKLTKIWLAQELGESTQNINNWKNRGVPASKLKQIADALEVSRDYLEDDLIAADGESSPSFLSDAQSELEERLLAGFRTLSDAEKLEWVTTLMVDRITKKK